MIKDTERSNNMELTSKQRSRLAEVRLEVLNNNHILSNERLRSIEDEFEKWSCLQNQNSKERKKFREVFDLYDLDGRRTGNHTWRGLCHWPWLRHGCVHGLLFTPTSMVIIQRRASSVGDSPGFLDMTFAGHMGQQSVYAAAMSEAKEEVNVDLSDTSDNVANRKDLEPIRSYDYIEPPRPNEEFYNAESRHVFAIRVTTKAMGAIKPLDGEVGSFVLASAEEAWMTFRSQAVASALRVSGPLAMYHALRHWGWGC
jgi:8-oxo-dGTP pyrophosphatase MutT (NUDIX family)